MAEASLGKPTANTASNALVAMVLMAFLHEIATGCLCERRYWQSIIRAGNGEIHKPSYTAAVHACLDTD
jgi:hypothetical protein